jgi:hypothetical protein
MTTFAALGEGAADGDGSIGVGLAAGVDGLDSAEGEASACWLGGVQAAVNNARPATTVARTTPPFTLL